MVACPCMAQEKPSNPQSLRSQLFTRGLCPEAIRRRYSSNTKQWNRHWKRCWKDGGCGGGSGISPVSPSAPISLLRTAKKPSFSSAIGGNWQKLASLLPLPIFSRFSRFASGHTELAQFPSKMFKFASIFNSFIVSKFQGFTISLNREPRYMTS